MDETRLRRVAEALGTVPVFGKHEIGEVVVMTLRDVLEDIRSYDDAISIEETLLKLARTAVEAYGPEPD